MTLLHRLKKLKRMSGGEISCRLSDAARRWQNQQAWRAGTARRRRLPCGEWAENLCQRAASLIPGTSALQLQHLKSLSPEVFGEISSRAQWRADQIMSGYHEILGFQARLTDPIDWHRDPRSQHQWPRDFHADLDLFELPDGIDVKYVWELNRHQFLVELSRGWMFSRDERFARRARELLLDWIDNNPLYEGVNWTSALETAVRGMSWLWTLAGLADWTGWQPGDQQRIAESVADHAQYLSEHFSFYSSPYNHLIGEAAGLHILGWWLDGIEPAAQWRSRSRKVLIEHGPQQFYRDGFCVEQATGYHFFTLGFLAHALATGQGSGEPIGELLASVTNAFGAGAAFLPPDGLWPALGDVDSARSIPVQPDNFWNFRSLYALAAVLCNRPDFTEIALKPGEELFWLFGAPGVETFLEMSHARRLQAAQPVHRNTERPNAPDVAAEIASSSPAKESVRIVVLPESGYAIATAGTGDTSDWLLFDCGPIAHGLFGDGTPSTAHGHADALQLLFHLKGRPVLTDPGMPFYFGSREWVDYFRGAAAHNTIEIEDCPMARHAGRLGWSHVCSAMHLNTKDCDQGHLISGTVKLNEGNSIIRTIRLIPKHGVWIADLITTDCPRLVHWNWQLPVDAECETSCLPDGFPGFRFGDKTFRQWTSAGMVPFEVERGSKDAPAGWQAPGYGTCLPAAVLRTCLRIDRQALAVTYLGNEKPSAAVRCGKFELNCSSTEAPLSPQSIRIDLSPEP